MVLYCGFNLQERLQFLCLRNKGFGIYGFNVFTHLALVQITHFLFYSFIAFYVFAICALSAMWWLFCDRELLISCSLCFLHYSLIYLLQATIYVAIFMNLCPDALPSEIWPFCFLICMLDVCRVLVRIVLNWNYWVLRGLSAGVGIFSYCRISGVCFDCVPVCICRLWRLWSCRSVTSVGYLVY